MKLDEIPDHEMKNDEVKEPYLVDKEQFSSAINLYNARENAYVRSSKENLNHIKSSWESLKKGQGKTHEWE
ncbi:hypothetical protein [Fructobacillus tropaeoli]|uniref:hypothetical protein n=1 Tax=Fructobacillus tropaeoli TaxID=709323 RepID=UPI002DAE5E48|nr:unnamed protein product [Fructobacillus tropaeoli]